jgi:hypothetical protein
MYLRSGTGSTTDGAQNVQTKIGGNDAQKNEAGGQDETALLKCQRDGQDATSDDCGDQSKRRRQKSGLTSWAVVLRIQDLNVWDVVVVRRRWRRSHGATLWGEQ